MAGGSRTYVDRVAKQLAAVRTATPVTGVAARPGTASSCATEAARRTVVDRVVIATHADQALRLLADPTDDERAVLGAFRYSRNPTLLHTDSSLLPRAPSRPGRPGTT